MTRQRRNYRADEWLRIITSDVPVSRLLYDVQFLSRTVDWFSSSYSADYLLYCSIGVPPQCIPSTVFFHPPPFGSGVASAFPWQFSLPFFFFLSILFWEGGLLKALLPLAERGGTGATRVALIGGASEVVRVYFFVRGSCGLVEEGLLFFLFLFTLVSPFFFFFFFLECILRVGH